MVVTLFLAALAQVSPYAADTARPIKALSQAEVRALTNGEGMGLAKAAELNRFPGPKHVLELAAELRLTSDQKARAQDAFDRMRAEAVRLGALIVSREEALDRAFREATIDADALRSAVREIALLQGELRATHLAAHLETRSSLTPEQVARYDQLRGYGSNTDPAHTGHH